MSPADTSGLLDALLRRALVFNHIHEALVVTAPDDRILDWNAGAERMFGWTRAEAVGQPSALLHEPVMPASPSKAMSALIARLGRWHGELRYRRKDGSAASCEAVGLPLVDADGRICGVMFVHAENDWELAETNLPRKKDDVPKSVPGPAVPGDAGPNEAFMLRGLVDAMPDPIFCKDPQGRYTLTNRANCELFGLDPAAMLGRTVFNIPGLKENAARYDADDRKVLETGAPILNREEPFTAPDGRNGWFLTSKFPLRDSLDRVVGLAGIARDITSRHVVESKVADERNFLQTLIDAIPDLIFFKDRQGRHMHINAADRTIFGLSDEQALGKTVREWPIPPEHAALYEKDDQQVMESGEPIINKEEPFQRTNGERGWFLTTKYPIRDASGTVVGLVGIARDITQLRQDRRELERVQERLLDHVENSPLAVIEWNSDFCVTRWAGQAENLFGWRAEEVVGKHFGDWPFVHPEDAARVQEVAQRLAGGEERRNSIQNRNLTKLGRIVHCSWQNSALLDESGRVSSILSLIQDISDRTIAEQAGRKAAAERQALERKLQESQKLESLGVLAGGIAHDFNNLLTGVLGNASLARMDLPEDSPVQPFLEQIESAAVRAADLCKQMLAYSGKGRFVVNRLDLNALIEDTTRLLQVSISKRAVMKFDLAPHLPVVLGDATQLRQVIMNLVINASEAIGDKSGFIAVTTGLTRADRAYLAGAYFARELPEGDYVSLEISDNGGGMAPAVLEKIFDPFFTTKFTGRGLGLAAVLGIVRGHKGALKVFSEPGWGTTFKILLPCAEGVADELARTTPSHADWKGAGNVLVVDDEETVRVTTARMLEASGFTTTLADNGRTGVEAFTATPDAFTLVMLDLTMPHMDGDEAFRAIRATRPEARVLLMSGFNEQEATARFTGKGLAGFVQKPFTLEALREKLQEIFRA